MNKINELPTSATIEEIELNAILSEATDSLGNLLREFANTSSFIADLKLAFGSNIDIKEPSQLWRSDKFVLPEIEIVDSIQIGNANGAFAQDTNKIYLSQNFLTLNSDNNNIISNVLLEEYGHYLDSKFNIVDTPGDEGAIFTALVQEQQLSDRELQQLKNEDDTTIAFLNGKEI